MPHLYICTPSNQNYCIITLFKLLFSSKAINRSQNGSSFTNAPIRQSDLLLKVSHDCALWSTKPDVSFSKNKSDKFNPENEVHTLFQKGFSNVLVWLLKKTKQKYKSKQLFQQDQVHPPFAL